MKRASIFGVGVLALLLGLAATVLQPPAFRNISRQMDDALRRVAAKRIQSHAIAILDIDEESLREFGQWPWPRTRLADITERLWRDSAQLVAWDIVFAEVDRTSPVHLLTQWRAQFGPAVEVHGIPAECVDHDALLAHSLANGVCVLSLYGELGFGTQRGPLDSCAESAKKQRVFEVGTPVREMLPHAKYIVPPIAILREAASGEAFFNTLSDEDNIVRRTPMIIVAGQRLYPSLSLEVLRLLHGRENIALVWDQRGWPGAAGLRVGATWIPTDANACLLLNFRSDAFPRVSLVEWWRGGYPGVFSNKIVFVGTSAAGLRDLVGTPMGPDVPGVEVHATALDNILSGDVLRCPAWMLPAKLGGLVVIGLLLVIVLTRCRALAAVVITILAVGLGWGACWHFLVSGGWFVSPSDYTLAMIFIYVAMTTAKYSVEERERRRVRKMFSAMVSAEVLEYLEAHPEDASARGRRVDATVFFSDITNFTALSERLDPEELTQWMNCYLTPMADAIMAEGGYVDKFNGDAIMAVWGAPFPVPDHALRACRAALEQVRRLNDIQVAFRERFGMDLRVRIGLNTGSMTAGNMGSNRRHQYTVMGDAVNVAARLQEANKELGTVVLIGEETWRRVKDSFRCRCVGAISVRGREQPVVAYELIGQDVGATKLTLS